MKYEMEELVPLVAKLAEKYTAFESTSITYEKAEQFMEAVLYCIHEPEQTGWPAAVLHEEMSAERAYEIGVACVEKKTRKALQLYNQILLQFRDYGNRCLRDTFVDGMPEFFRWYDVKFAPQNTILTLDYPVLRDLSGYTGIDKIYEYIKCIALEQKFLRVFPVNHVKKILLKTEKDVHSEESVSRACTGKHLTSVFIKAAAEMRHSEESVSRACTGKHFTDNFIETSGEMIYNICEAALTSVIVHILAEKPFAEALMEETDVILMQEKLGRKDLDELRKQLKSVVARFVEERCENGSELSEYLSGAVSDIAVRLKNAADSGVLGKLL